MTRYLHVTNGDSVTGTLGSAVPGEKTTWAEALHEGPIPLETAPEEWRQIRAHYYASRGWGTVAANLSKLAAWDRALEQFREYDEVVLWFEHDLFDQLLLIRHLDWFSKRDLGQTRLSLICIGEFPDVARFRGLGTLDSAQLASLFGTQHPVSNAQMRLGSDAWRAFGSSDPRAMESLLASDTSAIPFLADAFLRHLAEFPSTSNGLGRTESHALSLLSDGPRTAATLFVPIMEAEPRPYLGDTSLFAMVRDLTTGPAPLTAIVGQNNRDAFGANVLELTPLGRKVLSGDADRVTESGIDRHLGGVHLQGREVRWRWDEPLGRLSSC